ncbi:hypothetical protein BN1095_6710001 [Clostridioides difficile]|uniref:Uncharacterized protein n=1 Tax=Clostridioides difficile TaxID=1496 RepID=A0A069B133_CLODI|nr:hypothetical protein BN1095_6710001 [Clostridioides difficile]
MDGVDGGVVELPDGGLEADNQTRPALFCKACFKSAGRKVSPLWCSAQ